MVDQRVALTLLRKWTETANAEYGASVVVRGGSGWSTNHKACVLTFGPNRIERDVVEGYADYRSWTHLEPWVAWHGTTGVKALFANWVHEYAHALYRVRNGKRPYGQPHPREWFEIVAEINEQVAAIVAELQPGLAERLYPQLEDKPSVKTATARGNFKLGAWVQKTHKHDSYAVRNKSGSVSVFLVRHDVRDLDRAALRSLIERLIDQAVAAHALQVNALT